MISILVLLNRGVEPGIFTKSIIEVTERTWFMRKHFLNADCASILLGRGVRGNHKQPKRESRTLNMAPTVAHALRDLSWALARLADTLDEASSNSLEP